MAVPLRSRGMLAVDVAICRGSNANLAASAEVEEESIPNLVIGKYDNDKRDANPVAKDEEEYFPNMAIGMYDNDKRDANPVEANSMVIGH